MCIVLSCGDRVCAVGGKLAGASGCCCRRFVFLSRMGCVGSVRCMSIQGVDGAGPLDCAFLIPVIYAG